MTEQATDKQIAQLQKHKLHPQPWTLDTKEAWEILNKFYESDEKPNVPVVRPGFVPKAQPSASIKEFHLSPEQVNTNALDLAIKWKTTLGNGTELMEIAKKFKEFIENGN